MKALLLFPLLLHLIRGDKWDPVRETIRESIAAHAFPGAVAAVGDHNGLLFGEAFGNFTYGQPAPLNGWSPPMETSTLFDMASCTKVTMTTTATMMLYQWGYLHLDDLVSSPNLLGAAFAAQGKGPIKVLNLLLHNSGFPPDPNPNYYQKEFGCPQSKLLHPNQTFVCRDRIFASLLNQKLSHPIGSKYVYSDLSMITMMFVIGRVVYHNNLVEEKDLLPACVGDEPVSKIELSQCWYEAFIRKGVLEPIGMQNSGFLPAESKWRFAAPTWYDGGFRHETMQGVVSDGNAYALGGIAGHAGLFADAYDLYVFMVKILFALPDASITPNSTTVKLFTTVYNVSQSSRALGWDTNNYQANTYRGCGNLSSATFTHLGYTGTQLCGDPDRKIYTIFLTNRVYPNDTAASSRGVHAARQNFNNAVKAVLDSD